MNVRDVQKALIAQGYDLGKSKDDGIWGPLSERAMRQAQQKEHVVPTGRWQDSGFLFPKAQTAERSDGPVPISWLPQCHMTRIILHWTAGTHNASHLDSEHYHIIIEGDGHAVRGLHSIAQNADPLTGPYAAHTLNCNTGSIGLSMCCMGEAIERPFDSGPWPMTETQWSAAIAVAAQLAMRYSIPPAPRYILSHAEVQTTLGIQQRGKWDVARLSFNPTVIGAKACGDLFRAGVAALVK